MFNPWVGKILWRRKWQPTPVFLSGKSHGQRNLAAYSPWCHKESDTTEPLNNINHKVFLISLQIPWVMLLLLLSHFSRVRLLATPWTAAYQAPLPMGFPRQEYWSGLPFLSPSNLPDPSGVKHPSPPSAGRFFTTELPGKPPTI